uniref:winged helix-turn-helix domain-containing protein n=1 Tax=Prevotella sp. TaxID=59823 RepID=UPI003FF0FA63
MAEKKTTKTAVKKTTTTTAAKKAPVTKKATAAKKEVLYLNEENAGFKAGDVYQALAAAGKALSLAEIAKAAKITAEDAILGIGWLLKEGKIKNEDNKLVLA